MKKNNYYLSSQVELYACELKSYKIMKTKWNHVFIFNSDNKNECIDFTMICYNNFISKYDFE